MAVPDVARVVVLSRAGCHLCDDVERLVGAVCGDLGVAWRAVDVDGDPELRARFGDHVPVTFVDGRQVARWFLDEDALRASLAS